MKLTQTLIAPQEHKDRVWHSYHLLGTFYQAIDGESSAVLGFPQVKQLANPKGFWVVQSSYTDSQPRCNTLSEAQLLIVAIAGLLVADTVTESFDIDQLLDKPFDELTPLDSYFPYLVIADRPPSTTNNDRIAMVSLVSFLRR